MIYYSLADIMFPMNGFFNKKGKTQIESYKNKEGRMFELQIQIIFYKFITLVLK